MRPKPRPNGSLCGDSETAGIHKNLLTLTIDMLEVMHELTVKCERTILNQAIVLRVDNLQVQLPGCS